MAHADNWRQTNGDTAWRLATGGRSINDSRQIPSLREDKLVTDHYTVDSPRVTLPLCSLSNLLMGDNISIAGLTQNNRVINSFGRLAGLNTLCMGLEFEFR